MFKQILSMFMVISLAVTTACTNADSDQPVTLNFVSTYDGKEAELIKSRVKAFEQENPGIKVNFVEVGFGSASNYVKTAMLGDQTLDGFRSDNSWVPEFVELGLLYPIDSLIGPEDSADFNPTTLESVTIHGKLYGLPTVMEAPALLFNKRLLQEKGYSAPPKTMDELMAVAKKLTGSGRYGLYVSDDSYFALPYVWAFGGDTLTDDRKIHIASAESIKGLAFMQQLRDSGVTQPYPDFSDGYNRMMNDFKAGKSAMIVNGTWAVSDLLTGSEFQDAGNLGIAAVPAGPGGQGSPAGGHSLVVSKYSKHPEETYKLIHYLTSAEMQTTQTKELKTLPSRLSVYKDSSLASDAIVQSFKEVLASAKPRPRIPEGAQMFSDFSANLGQMLLDQLTPKETANNIDAAWRILLKQDR
ncbi:extracellular solute-binding protein [Paenibacillus sp. MMS18-CY102]|uniref:extracellular solute-binding protein n=1 Tax=Paenibacillus sp. MMS18-CY102 TaxID=2682849 RepID=UPI0013663FA6|nr:extracellular solute-binding protein [Paenibacillus sp. MMS18-CY102]MWC30522.1 extracellular solute-binding protein [Paenibacillus sp. MMS18-CY102]